MHTHPSKPPLKYSSRVSLVLSYTAFLFLIFKISLVFFALPTVASANSSGRAGGTHASSVAAKCIEVMGARSSGLKLNESRRWRSGGESTPLMTRIRPSPARVTNSVSRQARGVREKQAHLPSAPPRQPQPFHAHHQPRAAFLLVERWPWS